MVINTSVNLERTKELDKVRSLGVQIQNGQVTNTLVSSRMDNGPDKAPIFLQMAKNTLVNSGMENFMEKAGTYLVLLLSGQETNTLVNSSMTTSREKAPTPPQMVINTSVNGKITRNTEEASTP